jgi:hypothetical protein
MRTLPRLAARSLPFLLLLHCIRAEDASKLASRTESAMPNTQYGEQIGPIIISHKTNDHRINHVLSSLLLFVKTDKQYESAEEIDSHWERSSWPSSMLAPANTSAF